MSKEISFAKSQGGWNMARLVRGSCPTPQKRRFDSRESAAAAAPEGRLPYRCACGEWHLTTAKRRRRAS